MKKKTILAVAYFTLIWFSTVWVFKHYPAPVHAQAGQNNGQYTYINTATTTVVRNFSGYLNSVSVSGAGTVTFYDIAASGCTGTPASGKFAVITMPSSPAAVTMFYEVNVKNG